ncbi:acid protease [Pleurotus eryngii]|uniref:Acid protease n=1 Tax=Pleurotus eryngii TaxID=5323 RepID=A0A9P6D5W1_PLEER|nr:acid protease [Pleurotus eryngii]
MKPVNVLVFALASVPRVPAGLVQRDELVPIVRSNIPLVRTRDGRYGVTVNMSSSNPQTLAFALSTGTGLVSVLGSSCSNCTGSATYDPALSSSARLLAGTQGVSVLGQSTQGNLIREDCTLQKEDGTAWAYPNQTVVVANQSSPIFGGASGLLGLGTNALSSNFNETLFARWLSRNPGRTNFSYGMQLQPLGADGSTEGGVLHWVVPDDSAFQGTMSVKDKLSVGPSDMNLDWVVNLDSFSISTGDLKISKTNERVAIDLFFPGIFLPQSVSRPLFAGIPGSSSQPSSSSPATTAYTVPCDTKVTLDVRFGEFSVTLREDVLVFKNGTTCTSAFEEWNDQGMSEFLFGATFISAVYLVFTISGSNDGSIGFGARAGQATKIHPAAIAGIVIGSVAIVAIIVFTAVLVLRSRRRRRDDSKQENKIEPFGNATMQVDEQRGLLMPQTPTTAGTQGRFNVTPISSPNLSAYTTPFPSANMRQSLVTPLNAAPVVPSTANEINLLAPPPPYSGSSTSSHTRLKYRPSSYHLLLALHRGQPQQIQPVKGMDSSKKNDGVYHECDMPIVSLL